MTRRSESIRCQDEETAMESDGEGQGQGSGQTTSLQRLQKVENDIIEVLKVAGGVMDELANAAGPRKDQISEHCLSFMKLVKEIQMQLRAEIKSACEYRPFEKCDYSSRIANEICCEKLECLVSQLDEMKQTIDEYQISHI